MTAAIGHNQPPSALELASSSIEDLRRFLKDNPVIGNEDEARAAKLIFDRVAIALKGIEDERKSKVDPLNLQVRAINTEYHRWHNSGGKPGLWDMLLKTLKDRMTAFARAEEAKRQAAADIAREAVAKAEREAREAEQREREAAEEARMGVCGVDIHAAAQEADAAFRAFQKAGRTAALAERDAKVRIGGGFGRVSTLRNHEILAVTDWKAAIEEMSDDDGEIPAVIADAILTAARTYRKVCERLPAGISQSFERSL